MSLNDFQIPLEGTYYTPPCTALRPPVVPEVNIIQMSATPVHDFPIDTQKLNFCNVSLELAHPGENDNAYVTIWLPLTTWNGRYLATGGGGLAAGMGEGPLYHPVSQGYVSSSTDGGLTLQNTVDPQEGTWAIREDGSPNESLIENLAWRALHDAAVVSKELSRQFYGEYPVYSYYMGCSQGGRQGYAAAAKYPEDFDGVLAIAPALSGVYFAPADFWPPAIMHSEGVVPPFCVFQTYEKAITTECDPLDGVVDGLISNYDLINHCPFDPATLIGKKVQCPGESSDITITKAHADIVAKILDGPRQQNGKRLWYGLAPGASFEAVAKTVQNENKTWTPAPFIAAESWLKYLAMRNATYDMSHMTYSDFFHAAASSRDYLLHFFGEKFMDLEGFAGTGGKLLTWVGLADQYIPPQGVLDFRANLEKVYGGPEVVDRFYRLFYAPGVGHCLGGTGPQVVDGLGALVDWVENNRPPEVLPAKRENPVMTRDLCRYPKRLVYRHGDVNKAESFTCQ